MQRPYLGVTYHLCEFVFQFLRRHNMAGFREAVLMFHVKHDCLLSCESSSGMSPGQLQEQAASIASSSASMANSGWQVGGERFTRSPLHFYVYPPDSPCSLRPVGCVSRETSDRTSVSRFRDARQTGDK